MEIENSIPNAIYFRMAMTAFSAHEIISGHSKSHPLNHLPATVRAEGILALFARNISAIDISQPYFHPNRSRSMKGRNRRSRTIEHFIGWVKGGDMPGHLGPQGDDELGDFFKLLVGVV
jgi:hypothetical protein